MTPPKHDGNGGNGFLARLVAMETRMKNIESLATNNNSELLKINQEFRTRLDTIETSREISRRFIEKEQQEERADDQLKREHGFTSHLNKQSFVYLLIGVIFGEVLRGIFSTVPKLLLVMDRLSTIK